MQEPALPLSLRVRELELQGGAESFLAQEEVSAYNATIVNSALARKDSKLGTVEEVENRIIEYFDICEKTAQLPSIKAMSLYIGVPYNTLKKYLNDPTSRYYDVLLRAQDACHVVIENAALNNKVNPATYMFTAANFYGMKNTQSVEIGRSSAEKDLAASRESINALKEMIERERRGTTPDGAIEAIFKEKTNE